KFGFRNRDGDGVFDVVVTGDPYIGGANLRQEETFSSVLSTMCGCRVYNYGSIGFSAFRRLLVDAPFKALNKPQFIVVELPPHLEFLRAGSTDYKPVEKSDEIAQFRSMTPYEVLRDRFQKMAGFNFLYARIFDSVHIGCPSSGFAPQRAGQRSLKARAIWSD